MKNSGEILSVNANAYEFINEYVTEPVRAMRAERDAEKSEAASGEKKRQQSAPVTRLGLDVMASFTLQSLEDRGKQIADEKAEAVAKSKAYQERVSESKKKKKAEALEVLERKKAKEGKRRDGEVEEGEEGVGEGGAGHHPPRLE